MLVLVLVPAAGAGAQLHYLWSISHLSTAHQSDIAALTLVSYVDSVLNDALCIVTGCLRPIPTDHLTILSGIQPAELRRLKAIFSLAYRRSLDPENILHGFLTASSDARQERETKI